MGIWVTDSCLKVKGQLCLDSLFSSAGGCRCHPAAQGRLGGKGITGQRSILNLCFSFSLSVTLFLCPSLSLPLLSFSSFSPSLLLCLSLCQSFFLYFSLSLFAFLYHSLFLSSLSQLVGAALLGVGIWVKVDASSLLGFLSHIDNAPAELQQLTNVGYLLIGLGAALGLIGFLGCCGAVKESRCMLLTVSDL